MVDQGIHIIITYGTRSRHGDVSLLFYMHPIIIWSVCVLFYLTVEQSRQVIISESSPAGIGRLWNTWLHLPLKKLHSRSMRAFSWNSNSLRACSRLLNTNVVFFTSSLNIWRWCVSSILWCNWLRSIVICSITKQQNMCVYGLKKGTICWCNQSLSRECYRAETSLVRIPHCTMLFIKTTRKKKHCIFLFQFHY